MIGSSILKFRQKYQHGLGTAYFRDTVRLRILDTQPIARTTDNSCEIHVLTSEKDWLNLIWTLKSFYHFSERHYALCIHDDGSLSTTQKTTLQSHFPLARIIDRPDANADILGKLAAYPNCLEFRRTNLFAPRLFDFVEYLQSDRMLLIDSDVLFFRKPTVLIDRIEDPAYRFNTVNRDTASAYTVTSIEVKEKFEFDLIEQFNAGLALIHKTSVNWDWIEAFLMMPTIHDHFWRIEQTLFALCSSRFGIELLPPAYDVHLDGGIGDSPSRHYVGKIRHLMYDEGIRQLVKQDFLRTLSR